MHILQRPILRALVRSVVILCPGIFFSCTAIAIDGELVQSQKYNEEDNVLIIEGVICRGNENTRCEFITNKYYQNTGDVLDPEKIADARLRLGALIQFRDVKVYLEKGSEKGYVVVVFDVLEASHIQYELGFYGRYSVFKSQSTSFVFDPSNQTFGPVTSEEEQITRSQDISGSITDFNIFGTGKTLGLRVDAAYTELQFSSRLFSNGNLQTNIRDYTASVNYDDPHLFSSPYVYMGAQASRHSSKREAESSTIYNSGNRYSSSYYSIYFGSRFASSSSVSISAGKRRGAGNVSYSLGYGWDSQDDTVIPTKGSLFRIGISDSRNSPPTASVQLVKQKEIFPDKILSLNGHAYYSEVMENPAYAAGIGLTNILTRDIENGVYSGWYIALNASKNNSMIKIESAVVNAGYILQTEKLIMRFGLSYSKGEISQ